MKEDDYMGKLAKEIIIVDRIFIFPNNNNNNLANRLLLS